MFGDGILEDFVLVEILVSKLPLFEPVEHTLLLGILRRQLADLTFKLLESVLHFRIVGLHLTLGPAGLYTIKWLMGSKRLLQDGIHIGSSDVSDRSISQARGLSDISSNVLRFVVKGIIELAASVEELLLAIVISASKLFLGLVHG